MSDDAPAPAGAAPVTATGGAAAGAGAGAVATNEHNGFQQEKKPVITKSQFDSQIQHIISPTSRPMSTKSSIDLEDYFVRPLFAN